MFQQELAPSGSLTVSALGALLPLPTIFVLLGGLRWKARLYQITVVSGRFEDLRASFHLISDAPRVQAILIASCFGGLLEVLAGFGAPVAITDIGRLRSVDSEMERSEGRVGGAPVQDGGVARLRGPLSAPRPPPTMHVQGATT